MKFFLSIFLVLGIFLNLIVGFCNYVQAVIYPDWLVFQLVATCLAALVTAVFSYIEEVF